MRGEQPSSWSRHDYMDFAWVPLMSSHPRAFKAHLSRGWMEGWSRACSAIHVWPKRVQPRMASASPRGDRAHAFPTGLQKMLRVSWPCPWSSLG